jgi:hypothetical protein
MEFEVVVTKKGLYDSISPFMWSVKKCVVEEFGIHPLVGDHQAIVAP